MKTLLGRLGLVAVTAAASLNMTFGGGTQAGADPAIRLGHNSGLLTCPRVLLIGARGSAEMGYGGLGKVVYIVRHELGTALGSGNVRAAAVRYNTSSTWTLLRNVPRFFAHIRAGLSWALSYLTRQALKCKHQRIVLAGYSQGAMVMHRVLHRLDATRKGRGILARVVGAVLIGDGDQVSNDNQVTRYSTAPSGAEGAGLAYRRDGSGSSAAKFTASVGRNVLSVCHMNDPVCNWHHSDICNPRKSACMARWAHLIGIHLSYAKGNLVVRAAAEVARQILGGGETWTPVAAPVPSNAIAYRAVQLYSAACMSADSCVAVGSYVDNSFTGQGLLVTGRGTTWTASEAPLPADVGAYQEASLESVACPSPTRCVAVGWYIDSSRHYQPLLVTGSGAHWTAINVTLPIGAGLTSLSSVACPSASTCVAVGDSSPQPVLLTQTGTSWTATTVPLPPGVQTTSSALIRSVTCGSAASCVAVGTYADSSGNPQAVILTGSGGAWTATAAPAPPPSVIGAVTCASTISCTGVGWYSVSSSDTEGLIVTGSGSTWKAAKAPVPADVGKQPDVTPLSVACASTNSCVGVGTYADSSGDTQGLLLTGSGTKWIATKPPLLVSAGPGSAAVTSANVTLESVACPVATSCVAVGRYIGPSNDSKGLLLTGLRARWTPITAPLPAGGSNVWLQSVACASTTTCVAAGTYVDSSNFIEGLLLISTERRRFP